MSSALSDIPVERRKRLAGTLGLFAVLLIAIGAVAATGTSSAVLTVFVVIAFVAALVLALLAWGVAASVKIERADRRHELALDAAVAQALASGGHIGAPGSHADRGCGHDHDPSELHVSGDPCAHDGGGATGALACSQTCDTCVFARGARPAAAARRPQPGPRR